MGGLENVMGMNSFFSIGILHLHSCNGVYTLPRFCHVHNKNYSNSQISMSIRYGSLANALVMPIEPIRLPPDILLKLLQVESQPNAGQNGPYLTQRLVSIHVLL